MPQTLILASQPYAIPTKWEDVSVTQFKNYVRLEAFTIENIVHCLTGIPAHLLTEDLLEGYVLPALEFVATPLELDILPLPDSYQALDLSECSYGQKVDALQSLITSETLTNALPELLSIYLCPQPYDTAKAEAYKKVIESMPITEAYPIGKEFDRQLTQIEKAHQANLYRIDYTPEERRAGFHELERWGAYAIADALAGGNILDSDKVFLLPVSVVHTKIQYNNHVAHKQANLRKIHEQQLQAKTKL